MQRPAISNVRALALLAATYAGLSSGSPLKASPQNSAGTALNSIPASRTFEAAGRLHVPDNRTLILGHVNKIPLGTC
jgi:hypothetical protein